MEKTISQKDTCTPVFIVELFIILRIWKQPKYPSTDEWIKKLCYMYTMECYWATQSKEIVQFVEMWMDLETVIQSKIYQKEKHKYCILTYICGIQKNGTDDLICKIEIETHVVFWSFSCFCILVNDITMFLITWCRSLGSIFYSLLSLITYKWVRPTYLPL